MDVGRQCHYQHWRELLRDHPSELEVLQLVHQEDGNAAQIKLDVRLLFSFL